MPVRIDPCEDAKLQLSGDVETWVWLSARAVREGFAVAVSDGTLLRGSYDPKLRECRLVVAAEGAGGVSIRRGMYGDAVDLASQIEWIGITAGNDTLCSNTRSEATDQAAFAFDEPAKRAA